jgi:hypothetical protein
MAGRRPRDAWQQTTRTWRTELAYGCVGGLLSIAILAGVGSPKGGFVTAAIPVVSAVGAAIFVPLGQFLWRLAWQPWDDLKSQVGEISADASPMNASEQNIVTLRNYLRQGLELEAILQKGSSRCNDSEVDEVEDWTHRVVTCLWEFGTKAQSERFIDADAGCQRGFASHRNRAEARLVALQEIIKELDPPD